MSCSDTELEKAPDRSGPGLFRQILSVFPNGRSVQIANKNKKGEPIMARRKKKDQEGPVETRENDRAAEIEYRVMLARNLERNFGFGF